MTQNNSYVSFQQFWPFYLSQHQNQLSRLLHYFGTLTSHIALIVFILDKNWLGLILIPVLGYAPAWFGHFFIEKNKPATFKHPFWSLIADYKMFYLAMTGRLKLEVATDLDSFPEK